jgi:hypothetical protein
MIPILASAAVSLVGNIYHGLTTKSANATAQSAPQPAGGVDFSSVLNQAGASKAASQISFAQSAQNTADLATQLTKSTDVSAAINASGASGPMQIQLDSAGDATLCFGNGKTAPISLSNDMRGIAQQLYQAKVATQSAGAANSLATAPQMSNSVLISAA